MFLPSNTYHSSLNVNREIDKKEKEMRKERKPPVMSPVKSTQQTPSWLKYNSSTKSSTP
jgi:hypothetical protein